MAGGEKWKKPESIKGEHVRASVQRGPKKGSGGPVQWYWRIRERGKTGAQLWGGWATVDEVRVRMTQYHDYVRKNDKGHTPNKQESKMLKVAIVSKTDHAKSVTKRLKELGHMGFNFPDVSGPIPSSMDVIICRVKSTSHGAYDICNEAKRQGRIVVFENGVSKTIEAVKAIADGTWVEPSLVPDTAAETPSEEAEVLSDKQRRRSASRESILEIIDKGGIFSPLLCRRSPSQARDALEGVPWSRKHGVKRSAVYAAFNELKKLKESTIEAQYEELRSEQSHHEGQLWWAEEAATGSITFLSRVAITESQRGSFADALTRPGRTYGTEEPEELTSVAVLPDAEPVELPTEPEEPEVMDDGIQVSHEPPVEIEVEAEVVAAPPVEVATDETEVGGDDEDLGAQAEKDMRDLLFLLREQLEKMELTSVPESSLNEAGLRGSVQLALTHLASPIGGVGCGSKSALLSSRVDLARVTCPKCRTSEAFTYAAFYAAKAVEE
jgi:hypothetical protein